MSTAKTIYAGRLERLFANLIDTVILIIPGGLLAALLDHNGMITLATFLVSLGYYTHFTASGWQATPGKRLLGIYVIRTDHRRLTQRDAVERFLAYSIPSLPLYASFIPAQSAPLLVFWLSMFWFLPILITPERTGTHDRLCGTRVLVGKVGAQ
jgi:uncharacterized RDD family membrane protein YckC